MRGGRVLALVAALALVVALADAAPRRAAPASPRERGPDLFGGYMAGSSIGDADTDWGLGLGGGLDYRISGRWSVRGLVHLRLLWGEGAMDEDPRLSIGAVYRFGH